MPGAPGHSFLARQAAERMSGTADTADTGSLRLEKIKENRKTPVFFWNFYNLGLVFSNVLCYNSKRCYVRVTEK